MRNREGEDRHRSLCPPAAQHFFRSPTHRVEASAGGRVSFKPPFDAAGDIQEDGLRTSPPAPDAANQGGDVKETEAKASEQKEAQPHVLHQEGEAEEVELPL